MTTPWSDTPPSEPGTYWVRPVGGKYEFPWECDKTGAGGMWSVADLEFGPRVLTAEETVALTAEVERLREDIQRVREWRDEAAKTNAGTIASLEAEIQELRAENVELRESRTEADERAAFDEWHEMLYGWRWDGIETPEGEDARARARWMAWRARAGLGKAVRK